MNTLVIALSAFLGQAGDAPAATAQPSPTPAPMTAQSMETQEQRRGLLGRRTTTTSATSTPTTTGERRMGLFRNSERTPLFQGRLLGRNRS